MTMSIVKQTNKKTGITYVYESHSYWDPEKKQAWSKRKLIGKLDPVTGDIIPTGKKGPKKKSEETKEHMLSQNSKGYGMRNVNQRIKLLYGEEYGLHIESVVGEGTVVTIRLPKRKFVKRDPQR